MKRTSLIRQSGLASMAGGVLLALFFVLHPGGREPGNASTLLNTPYAAEHTLGVGAYVLILLGLVGAYACQSERAGLIGLVGFLLAFVGTALLVGVFMHDGYELPELARIAPNSVLPTGPLNIAIVVAGATVVLGFVLFGIATMRAAVLPRWAGLLLIVGAVVAHLPPPPDSPLPITWPVIAAGAVVLGAGLVWIGYAVWSRPPG